MSLTERVAIDGRKLYQCDACGLLEPWSEGWQWYGSYRDLEDEPQSILTFCSSKCIEDAQHLGIAPVAPIEVPKRNRRRRA